MEAIYIAIIMLMRVTQSTFSKKAALVLPDGIKPYIAYISVSKLFSAMFALAIILPTMNFSGINPQAVLIAACSGSFLAINSICGIKALIGGTIALNSMFATAGMVIPIILGIFVFNESVSWIQAICICVLFFAVFLLVNSTKNTLKSFSFKTLGWLVGSLVSNGMVMFCQKLFGELQPNGNVSMFSMFTFLIPAAVLGISLPFIKSQKSSPVTEGAEASVKSEGALLPKILIIYAVALAFAVFMIQQLVTLLTPVMSGAVLFTIVNGGATVIATIVGAVLYKEKITFKTVIGLILGIGAMICIKVFE